MLNNILFFRKSISPTSRLASLSKVSQIPQGIAKNQDKNKRGQLRLYFDEMFEILEQGILRASEELRLEGLWKE